MMRPIRLNLGCGSTVVDGWVNIDRSPGPLLDRFSTLKKALFRFGVISSEHLASWPKGIVRLDIRKRLPYDDGSVDAIYSSHTLEHLYLGEANAVLREALRVLRPEGLLRLALPDSEVLAREFVRELESDPAEATIRFNAGLLAHPLESPRRRQKLAVAVGANVHRWQPTSALVSTMLEEAGFTSIERKRFRQGALPEVELVEHRESSFFIEATKPERSPS